MSRAPAAPVGAAAPASDADRIPDEVTPLVRSVDGAPTLVGGRCERCGTTTFPAPEACPRCSATEVAPQLLPRTGVVWTWTVQRLAPKPPYEGADPFQPYAVGYVDLGSVLVEARLEGRDPEGWDIGDAVEVSVGRRAGDATHGHHFVPVAGEDER